MRKKQVMAMALSAAMAAGVLGGTGIMAAAEDTVTLTFPVWDLASTPYIQDVVDGFEAENPNIKINIVDIAAADYVTKLTTMLNGGSECDIVYIKEADGTPSYADKGQLEDLTSYIEADGIDTSKFVGYDDFNLDGKQVALPFKTDYYVLYYNKDIFDAAGVDYPSNDMTWTEWEEMCKSLTSGEGNDKIYGGYLHTWQACVQNWAVQDGENTILGPDYSFMKPYYEMALRMQEEGTIMDYATLKTGNIAYASPFQQGTVATLPMGTWFSSTMIAKVNAYSAEVNQMLGEEHSLIMIGEADIDTVLAEMATRSQEIQAE